VINSDIPRTATELNSNKMLYVCFKLKVYKKMLNNRGIPINNEENLVREMKNDECLILIQEFFVEPLI
jgi:hypothetical protein